MKDNSLTIMFDNAPSLHKEGVIERLAKDSDILLLHLSNTNDYYHPSRKYLKNISFLKKRYILDSNSELKDIKNSISDIVKKYQRNKKQYKSVKIIYSFIDFKRLFLVLYLKSKVINLSSTISIVSYLEPIRFNDAKVIFRLTRILISLIFQKYFLGTSFIYLTSSLNSFFYKLFFKNFLILPYKQTQSYIDNCKTISIIPQSTKYKILFIGQLIPRKNPLLLLNACEKLKFPVDLTILGKGKLKEKIIRKINKINKKDLTVNLLDSLDNKNIYKIIKSNDVLVLPSQFDGFGFVVAEAIYCQTFAIVSSNVGSKDMIDNGKNGSIFMNNSLNDLINHLNLHYLKKKYYE